MISGHYTPQAYPMWAWERGPDGIPINPRLVIGWSYPAGRTQPVFAPTEKESGLLFRVSPFDPDVITT